jgi:oligo-1,6-glucosidase
MTDKTTEWWRSAVFYQIYPRSFADSNGDGVGDIPGIISKLDYLADLGVDCLWLSPVYKSPNDDMGYDVADHLDVNPEYGSLDDMRRLFAQAKGRGIRIIMDLVVNHTSDEHPWFVAGRDPASPYHDYYVWRPGRKRGRKESPPNNWQSVFTGPAWERDAESGLYYLHLFTKKQPDLNHRNPKVVAEVERILDFWLDLGAAGFRCDVIGSLWKTTLDDGRPRVFNTGEEHYLNQDGCHEILRGLHERVLGPRGAYTVGETAGVDVAQHRRLTTGELTQVFQFDHFGLTKAVVPVFPKRYRPEAMRRVLLRWHTLPEWNTVFFENHDETRSVDRYGDVGPHFERSAKLLATVLLTLRGTPYLYQGEELGVVNAPFAGIEEIRDVASVDVYRLLRRFGFPDGLALRVVNHFTRDHSRRPFQWTAGAQGGFTRGTPWIAAHPQAAGVNAEAQGRAAGSILNHYKALIRLRRENPDLVLGDLRVLDLARDVLAYTRGDGDEFAVVCNLGRRRRQLSRTLRGEVLLSNFAAPGDATLGYVPPFGAVVLRLR